jgi:hypothetical protein
VGKLRSTTSTSTSIWRLSKPRVAAEKTRASINKKNSQFMKQKQGENKKQPLRNLSYRAFVTRGNPAVFVRTFYQAVIF